MGKKLLEIVDRCKLKRNFKDCNIHRDSPTNCGDCEHFIGLFKDIDFDKFNSLKKKCMEDIFITGRTILPTLEEYLKSE